MRYHNIVHDDMRNGDGLRVTLFVAGCEHHCHNCQNPITWNPNDGVEFGFKEITEISEELSKDHISGLTLSGGDPLHPANIDEITGMVILFRDTFPDKTIWLYTGYEWEKIKDLYIMRFVDVVVDGKFCEELASVPYEWAGSTNQRVIDVQRSKREGRVVLYDSDRKH